MRIGDMTYDKPAKDVVSSRQHVFKAWIEPGCVAVRAFDNVRLVDVDPSPAWSAETITNQRDEKRPLSGEWARIQFPSGYHVDRQLDAEGALRLELSEVPVEAFFPLANVAVASLPNKVAGDSGRDFVATISLAEKAPQERCSKTLEMLPDAVRQRAEGLVSATQSARERLREAEARYRDAVSGPEAALRDLTEANRPYSIQGEVIETRENVIVLKGHATIYGRQGEGSIINGYIAVYNYDKRVLANHNYQFYIGQHYFLGPIYERVWLMQSGPIMTYGDMPSDARRKIEPAEARLRKAQAAASPAYEEAKRVCAEAEARYRASLPTDPFGLFPEPPEKKTKGGKK